MSSRELVTTPVKLPDMLQNGGRPAHKHTDAVGNTWSCDSPYCEFMVQEHPSNGGPAPITQGREPWRGHF